MYVVHTRFLTADGIFFFRLIVFIYTSLYDIIYLSDFKKKVEKNITCKLQKNWTLLLQLITSVAMEAYTKRETADATTDEPYRGRKIHNRGSIQVILVFYAKQHHQTTGEIVVSDKLKLDVPANSWIPMPDLPQNSFFRLKGTKKEYAWADALLAYEPVTYSDIYVMPDNTIMFALDFLREELLAKYKRWTDARTNPKFGTFGTDMTKEIAAAAGITPEEVRFFLEIRDAQQGYFGGEKYVETALGTQIIIDEPDDTIDPNESAVVMARLDKTRNALQKLGLPKDTKIALVLSSGAGLVSTATVCATLDALKDAGLLDCITYISGSAETGATLAAWYASKSSQFHNHWINPQDSFDPLAYGNNFSNEHRKREGVHTMIPTTSLKEWILHSSKVLLGTIWSKVGYKELNLTAVLLEEYLSGVYLSSEYQNGRRSLEYKVSQNKQPAYAAGSYPYLISTCATYDPIDRKWLTVELTPGDGRKDATISCHGKRVDFNSLGIGTAENGSVASKAPHAKTNTFGTFASLLFNGSRFDTNCTLRDFASSHGCTKTLGDLLCTLYPSSVHNVPLNQIANVYPTILHDTNRTYINFREPSVSTTMPLEQFSAASGRSVDLIVAVDYRFNPTGCGGLVDAVQAEHLTGIDVKTLRELPLKAGGVVTIPSANNAEPHICYISVDTGINPNEFKIAEAKAQSVMTSTESAINRVVPNIKKAITFAANAKGKN